MTYKDRLFITAFLWSVFLLVGVGMPTILAADADTAFARAIKAVEDRNYEQLIQILENEPEVLRYSEYENCTLFCELSQLSQNPQDGGWPYKPNVVALNLLLHFGGDPSLSPDLLQSLLSSANEFDGKDEEFPIYSRQCTQNRNRLFPLINRMIENGAYLGQIDPNLVSLGAFYGFQLCHVVFMCGADYEQPSTEVTRMVAENLSLDERLELARGVSVGTLQRLCTQQFLNYF